jgi:hypothetical protein
MLRIVKISLVLALLALVAGGVSLASGDPANANKPLILNLISRATAINNFVDTGPAGFSPGDLYVFSDRYFLAGTPTLEVGRVDGRCMLIDPAALRFDCSITNTLSGNGGIQAGDVMAAGTLTLVQGATSNFAIVGGTGNYANARGDASVLLGPLEGPHEVTVRLILTP